MSERRVYITCPDRLSGTGSESSLAICQCDAEDGDYITDLVALA